MEQHVPKRCKRAKGDDDLTEKQRRFVEAYMGEAAGNGTLAARLAGYMGNDHTLHAIGTENLRKPAVARAIEQRVEDDPSVATRKRRQEFWTEVMESPAVEMKDRLKASELLGRTQGDFVERKEVSGPNGGPIELTKPPVLDLSKLDEEQFKQLGELLENAGYIE